MKYLILFLSLSFVLLSCNKESDDLTKKSSEKNSSNCVLKKLSGLMDVNNDSFEYIYSDGFLNQEVKYFNGDPLNTQLNYSRDENGRILTSTHKLTSNGTTLDSTIFRYDGNVCKEIRYQLFNVGLRKNQSGQVESYTYYTYRAYILEYEENGYLKLMREYFLENLHDNFDGLPFYQSNFTCDSKGRVIKKVKNYHDKSGNFYSKFDEVEYTYNVDLPQTQLVQAPIYELDESTYGLKMIPNFSEMKLNNFQSSFLSRHYKIEYSEFMGNYPQKIKILDMNNSKSYESKLEYSCQ